VRAKAARRERRLARYNEVMALRRQGMSQRAIAREVGLNVRTVAGWLAAGRFPERKERAPHGSKLDPHLAYLEGRLHDGCWNASQLWRELRARGFHGGLTLVKDEVRRRRRGGARRPIIVRRHCRRSARTTAWLLVLGDEELRPEDRFYVDALLELSPEVALVRGLAREFRRMLRDRDVYGLGGWIETARQSPLRRFGECIHADVAAARAAIELPWSNGPVEGQVNRLKLLKRQMYGRANFDLLRARVLAA
jgi:transposase